MLVFWEEIQKSGEGTESKRNGGLKKMTKNQRRERS